MLMAAQILVNYTTIIENTVTIKAQTASVEEEMDYIKNYQLKYLNSDHAKFFLSHENNILSDWESIIAFKKQTEKSDSISEKPWEEKNTPREERKAYIQEKLE